jgi:hypothetical protein
MSQLDDLLTAARYMRDLVDEVYGTDNDPSDIPEEADFRRHSAALAAFDRSRYLDDPATRRRWAGWRRRLRPTRLLIPFRLVDGVADFRKMPPPSSLT